MDEESLASWAVLSPLCLGIAPHGAGWEHEPARARRWEVDSETPTTGSSWASGAGSHPRRAPCDPHPGLSPVNRYSPGQPEPPQSLGVHPRALDSAQNLGVLLCAPHLAAGSGLPPDQPSELITGSSHGVSFRAPKCQVLHCSGGDRELVPQRGEGPWQMALLACSLRLYSYFLVLFRHLCSCENSHLVNFL